jgi:hypothetical protein
MRETAWLATGLDAVPMFAGAPATASNVTVWATDWNVHVTVPPAVMFTVAGENASAASAVTAAVLERAVTVTFDVPVFVTPLAVRDPVIVTGPPTATDVTSPELLTVACAASSDDHVAAPSPLMALPF